MNTDFHILVVDDDREDHLIMLDYFVEAGIGEAIQFYENGLKALEFLDGIALDRDLPKLIILDLNMPILNGTQTLSQLKNSVRYKNIPVVIYSTSENFIEKQKCLNLGAVDYLVKPITFEDGRKMVQQFSTYLDAGNLH